MKSPTKTQGKPIMRSWERYIAIPRTNRMSVGTCSQRFLSETQPSSEANRMRFRRWLKTTSRGLRGTFRSSLLSRDLLPSQRKRKSITRTWRLNMK
jgi:hypothetical protein